MKKTEKQLQKNSKKAKKRIALTEGGGELYEPPQTEKTGIRLRIAEAATALGLGKGQSRDPAVVAAGIFKGVCLGIIAFLFGRTSLLLDTYPLGIALLSSAQEKLIYIFTGVAVSAFTVSAAEEGLIFSPYVYLASYAMIILIRIAARVFIDPPEGFRAKMLFSRKITAEKRFSALRLLIVSRFEENIYLRMATSCVAAFLVSLYAMSAGSYRYYDLFSAMFAMIGAPAVTFIFSGIHSETETAVGKSLRTAAEIAMLTAAVFALRETYILGISAAVFTAFGAVLYLARKKGILYASIAGFAVGMAVSPIYVPAFILGAIAAGVVPGSAFTASACAAGVAMLWGAYIDGISAFMTFMPALLSSSVLVCAADSLAMIPKNYRERTEAEKEAKILEKEKEESAEQRMSRLGKTFGELSKALYSISDTLHSPGMSELRAICSRSFEKSCAGCAKNDECRVREYSEYSEMVSKVSEILGRDGRVRPERLPEHIPKKCDRINDILIEVNTSFAELLQERMAGEKTELFALDYDAVSHILADATEDTKQENRLDSELTERLCRFGARPDIGIKEISVRGNRQKRIFSGNIGRKAEEMGVDELRQELEGICGFPLTDPIFELRHGKVAMRLESARRFKAETGMAIRARAGEDICGDTASAFETDKDNFYALISDGMGSGRSAAITSELCSLFLEKMLEGGNKKETSLKMLNTLLRSKGEECSATVDLMEIDLITGQASFIKSGAAPSFVRRGDKLYKLRSTTAPIGIMKAIDAEQVRFDLSDGDIIIMLSDGIGQSPEECVWLMEMLGGICESNEGLKDIAEKIVERATKEGCDDDISVLLVKVSEI